MYPLCGPSNSKGHLIGGANAHHPRARGYHRAAGRYGWPPDDAARIAVTTVHAAGHPQLTEARFVLFTPDVYDHFRHALATLIQGQNQ
jgi:hypothetical protein